VDEGGGVVLRANVRSLASVANEYLDTALLLIDEKYNGLDNYIKNILKIDDELIQSLRELYLEPKRASK
nr:tyrosine-protein phosphatase [Lactobacillus gasseri]